MSKELAVYSGRITFRIPDDATPEVVEQAEAPTVDSLEQVIKAELEQEYGVEVNVALSKADA